MTRRSLGVLTAAIVTVSVLIGCSSSDSGDGGSCVYQGKSYSVGVISSDRCGSCSCESNGYVFCTERACLPPGAGGSSPGAGGSDAGLALGLLDAARGAGGAMLDAASRSDATTLPPYPGGPCGTDTCAEGQVCLSLTTVSGQFNPNGGASSQTQTTRSCRTVPAACPRTGSCDPNCCRALCGGGTGAMCSCGLQATSAGCTLGLP